MDIKDTDSANINSKEAEIKRRKEEKRIKAFKKQMKRKRIAGRIQINLNRRKRAESRFLLLSKLSVCIALLFLLSMFTSIVMKASKAFVTTEIMLPVAAVDIKDGKLLDYGQFVVNSLVAIVPEAKENANIRKILPLFGKDTANIIELNLQNLQLDPSQNNSEPNNNIVREVWVPASSIVDMFFKSNTENASKLNEVQVNWLKSLQQNGRVRTVFNKNFFTKGDSREPEQAGVLGSVVGSILVIISCMLLSLPLGIMTAIYLEEFAPKNRFNHFIEVNINNLAAVPSIIYGLLGLTIYIQFMGVPRSAPLAGGLTLALMSLPVIVIATRTAIRSIPRNIREGAVALGASHLEVLWHHVLPLSMPGIMTGTILSMARVMGETAPLIMVGMVAFVVNIPEGFLSPATAMPVQIYLWSDSAEPGFIEKTSAAIVVLLLLLALINMGAVYLRKKFEVRW